MSDVVEKLRDQLMLENPGPGHFLRPILMEAADELMRLRENLAATQQEKFLAKGKLVEARQAARECWQLIYKSGTKPISDADCAALSEERPWLVRKNGGEAES